MFQNLSRAHVAVRIGEEKGEEFPLALRESSNLAPEDNGARIAVEDYA